MSCQKTERNVHGLQSVLGQKRTTRVVRRSLSEANRTTFTTNLNQLMEENNLVPVQLAVSIGVPLTTVQSWKGGKSIPTAARMKALTSFFGVQSLTAT